MTVEQNDAQRTSNQLVFELANELYAIPANLVREVARFRSFTLVPGAPAALPGVISMRGAVTPVVDLRAALRLPTIEPNRAARFILVRLSDIDMALIVDRVYDLEELDVRQFLPTPVTLDQGRVGLVSNIAQHNEQTLALLDLEALVSALREGR